MMISTSIPETDANDGPSDHLDRYGAPPGISILTVGDGDFSCSLAILRAYGCRVAKLVATTLLPSESELLATYPYPSTNRILNDLKKRSSKLDATEVTILFGVDATQLHVNETIVSLGPFDYILFHHPHLGYARDGWNCPPDLATRHSSLLAHYLYSAREILADGVPKCVPAPYIEERPWRASTRDGHVPCIHVCLCAGQSKSWKLKAILSRLNLEYNEPPRFAGKPLFPRLIASSPFEEEKDDHIPFNVPSKECEATDYWLRQYGYNHQPTHPATTQLSPIINSHHHFFRKNASMRVNFKHDDWHYVLKGLSSDSTPEDIDPSPFAHNGNQSSDVVCRICRRIFENSNALRDHWRVPALPVASSLAVEVDLGVNQRLKRRMPG
jgi:Domain of unknown function (DUF2431)